MKCTSDRAVAAAERGTARQLTGRENEMNEQKIGSAALAAWADEERYAGFDITVEQIGGLAGPETTQELVFSSKGIAGLSTAGEPFWFEADGIGQAIARGRRLFDGTATDKDIAAFEACGGEWTPDEDEHDA